MNNRQAEILALLSVKMCQPDGSCGDCRECCSLFTPITKKELKFLKKKLTNKLKLEFIAPLAEGLLYAFCPFSTLEGKCIIYEDRPLICRGYHCDSSRISGIPFDHKEKCEYMIIDILPKSIKTLVKHKLNINMENKND